MKWETRRVYFQNSQRPNGRSPINLFGHQLIRTTKTLRSRSQKQRTKAIKGASTHEGPFATRCHQDARGSHFELVQIARPPSFVEAQNKTNSNQLSEVILSCKRRRIFRRTTTRKRFETRERCRLYHQTVLRVWYARWACGRLRKWKAGPDQRLLWSP